jgi:F-type H+-transporting ATPase subunit epsilon
MYLEIITPDTRLFEGEVSSVTLPGEKGSFQILNNHAPVISILQAGTIKIKMAHAHASTVDPGSGRVIFDSKDENTALINLKRGVVEMKNNNIIVLVD